MNCHNGEKYLLKSIKSIRKQSYSNWELIFLITLLMIEAYQSQSHLKIIG